MTLAEVIYEKSRALPPETAREVIDFIDFLKSRADAALPLIDVDAPDRRAQALARLDKVRIDFGGKPMTDRDAANARD